MPKRVTAFELMLSARDPGTPAYRWIYSALRNEILEGPSIDFAGGAAYQVLGKIDRPNERDSTVARMKQMNRTASSNCHICKT